MRYTFGSQIEANPYHVSIVRTKLTRSIPELFPVLHDEIVEAFSKYIPPTNGSACIILTLPPTDQKTKNRLVQYEVV